MANSKEHKYITYEWPCPYWIKSYKKSIAYFMTKFLWYSPFWPLHRMTTYVDNYNNFINVVCLRRQCSDTNRNIKMVGVLFIIPFTILSYHRYNIFRTLNHNIPMYYFTRILDINIKSSLGFWALGYMKSISRVAQDI